MNFSTGFYSIPMIIAQVVNLMLILCVVIGIPWFMITVVSLLKKILRRLEALEKE